MSNQLQENLDLILQEKNSKLFPENLRAGITLLGVTGTMQEGGSGEGSQASNIIHDTSELYNYSPNEGDMRFYMSYDNTQLYNIFKYVDGEWQEHRLNNAIFGDDYENSVAGTNSILYDSTGGNSGDNSGGNSGIIYDTELPADYDGHLDEIGTFMANLGTTDGCVVSGLSMSTPSLTKTMEETMFATNYLNNWLPDAQGDGLNVLLYSSDKIMQIGVNKTFPYRRVSIMDNNNTSIDLYTETFMDSMVKDAWSTEYFDGDTTTFTALTQEQLDTTDFSGLYDNINTVQVYGDSGHITRNNIINALLILEKIFNCTITYNQGNQEYYHTLYFDDAPITELRISDMYVNDLSHIQSTEYSTFSRMYLHEGQECFIEVFSKDAGLMREIDDYIDITASGIEVRGGYNERDGKTYYYWSDDNLDYAISVGTSENLSGVILSLIDDIQVILRDTGGDNGDTEIAKRFEFSYPNNGSVTGITFHEGVGAYNIHYNGAESTDYQFIYNMYLVGDTIPVVYEHYTSLSEGYMVTYSNELGTLPTNAVITYSIQYPGTESQCYWYTYEFNCGRVIYKDIPGKELKSVEYFEALSQAIEVAIVV